MHSDDRLLVLGAGGWFGQSLLEVVGGEIPGLRILATASSERELRTPLGEWHLCLPEREQIRAFAPTVVANFSFLTRDWIVRLGESVYREVNARLLEDFAHAGSLPSVRAVLTSSSGAAVMGEPDAYGEMKQIEEALATELAGSERASVVARAYSVSGPWVRNPAAYAFSDFIQQARRGHINVRADRPTFRRYVDAGDYLAVCLRLALDGWSGVVESGGPQIEMRRLAQRVQALVNPHAQISAASLIDDQRSVYASDGSSWSAAIAALGYHPLDLPSQVKRTARFLPCQMQP